MASSTAPPSIGTDDLSVGLSPSTTTTATDMFRAYADASRPHRSQKTCPDPSLATGMPLPTHLRQAFPKELIGKPIDEFDPFYANKTTFVVVGHHWTIYRFDGERSLFVLSPASRVRNASITTVTHAAFHYFMFLVILTNVICFSYKFNELQEYMFLIYFIEMIIKVIAYGFLVKRFNYLRDPWNWVDFLSTMIGFVSFFVVSSSMVPIRFIRLVNFFTRSRLTFATSCSLLLKMRDVLCLAVFSLFFYSVYFMTFYAGVLWSQCETFNVSTGGITRHTLCRQGSALRTTTGCPWHYTCVAVRGANPSYGLSNFESFLYSAMSILRVMTRDWWEELLTQVESTTGAWSVPNFLIVLVFGSFVLSNFIMAHMAIAHGQLMCILEGKKNIKTVEDKKRDREDFTNLGSADAVNVDETAGKESCEYISDASKQPSNAEVSALYEKSDSPKKEPQVTIVMDTKGNTPNKMEDMDANLLAACCSSCCEFFCACKYCSRLQTCLSAIVLSRYFDWFICATIATNMITMALNHHGISKTLLSVLYSFNLIVLLIFIVEAVLKILAMSPNRYFRDSWCIFEFVIVLISILEFGLLGVQGFLILRVIRLAKFYTHLNQLLRLTYVNAYVLSVFIVAFGFLGYDKFASSYWRSIHYEHPLKDKLAIPRLNFNEHWHSLIIVLRVLCGQWSEAYWECNQFSGSVCLPYFFVILVLGNLLVFNVFISLIMTSLKSNHLSKTDAEESAYLDFSVIGDVFRRFCTCRQKQGAEKLPAAKSEEQLFEISLEGETTRRQFDLNITEGSSGGAVAELCCPTTCYSLYGSPASFTTSSITPQDNFWTKWSRVRNGALEFTDHRFFHNVASVFIFVTSAMQALDHEQEVRVSRVASIVVCVVFSSELALKFLGIGFRKYFSEAWNRFDFAVTTLHILGYLLTGFGTHRSLELLKSLRVLKLFSYHERLRVVFEAILYRFGYVVSASLASLILWLIFAILGVQLFDFHKCVDSHYKTLPVGVVYGYHDCLHKNFTWVNSDVNFDNVPNALYALLQMATMRGDLPILFNIMDGGGYDSQPSRDANFHLSAYFMMFMTFGVLCCLACLFRAFITKANSQSRISGGYLETMMTPVQKFDYTDSKKTFFKKPLKAVPEPDVTCLLSLYRLVTSRTFNLVVFLVLMFNAAGMVLHYPFLGSRMHYALEYVQIAFNTFFFIEIVLKLIAFRRHFFDNSWNIYDFAVIMPLPLVVIAVTMMHKFIVSPLIFQLLILLRLVRQIRCVRRIFHGIWVSGAVYKNVAFVLLVIVFFSTRLGVGWFGNSERPYQAGIDELHNFNQFVPAMSTMTQMALGGLWNEIHRGLLPTHSDYCHDQPEKCPSSLQTTLFVLSYLLICFLIIDHFAAVLFLEHYERLWKKMRLGITDQDLEDFSAAWSLFDPYGTGTMSYENFSTFLGALPPTYKVEPPIDDGKIASLGITVTLQEQRLTFDDVLVSLLAKLDTDGVVFNPK